MISYEAVVMKLKSTTMTTNQIELFPTQLGGHKGHNKAWGPHLKCKRWVYSRPNHYRRRWVQRPKSPLWLPLLHARPRPGGHPGVPSRPRGLPRIASLNLGGEKRSPAPRRSQPWGAQLRAKPRTTSCIRRNRIRVRDVCSAVEDVQTKPSSYQGFKRKPLSYLVGSTHRLSQPVGIHWEVYTPLSTIWQ